MRSMLVALLLAGAALAALPSVSATQELPVGCNQDVGACVWQDTPNGDCAGVHFGLQGAGACAATDPVGVRACSSVRSALWEGPCPTDAIVLSSAPLCVGEPGVVAACVGVAPTGTCAAVGIGLQGASACVGGQGLVRVCTSAYTVFWGYCPTDLVSLA